MVRGRYRALHSLPLTIQIFRLRCRYEIAFCCRHQSGPFTTFSDIVVWDSHPLALGATPKQVWIDGIAQLESPYSSEKPASFQKPPVTPNFDKETYEAIKHEGLPPLKLQSSKSEIVIFTNVSNIFVRSKDTIHELFSGSADKSRTVVIKDGVMVCDGSDSSCDENYKTAGAEYVNLEAGSLS